MFLNNIFDLATDIVVTPLAVVRDTIKLPEIISGEEDSKTDKKIKDITKKIEKLIDNE